LLWLSRNRIHYFKAYSLFQDKMNTNLHGLHRRRNDLFTLCQHWSSLEKRSYCLVTASQNYNKYVMIWRFQSLHENAVSFPYTQYNASSRPCIPLSGGLSFSVQISMNYSYLLFQRDVNFTKAL